MEVSRSVALLLLGTYTFGLNETQCFLGLGVWVTFEPLSCLLDSSWSVALGNKSFEPSHSSDGSKSFCGSLNSRYLHIWCVGNPMFFGLGGLGYLRAFEMFARF